MAPTDPIRLPDPRTFASESEAQYTPPVFDLFQTPIRLGGASVTIHGNPPDVRQSAPFISDQLGFRAHLELVPGVEVRRAYTDGLLPAEETVFKAGPYWYGFGLDVTTRHDPFGSIDRYLRVDFEMIDKGERFADTTFSHYNPRTDVLALGVTNLVGVNAGFPLDRGLKHFDLGVYTATGLTLFGQPFGGGQGFGCTVALGQSASLLRQGDPYSAELLVRFEYEYPFETVSGGSGNHLFFDTFQSGAYLLMTSRSAELSLMQLDQFGFRKKSLGGILATEGIGLLDTTLALHYTDNMLDDIYKQNEIAGHTVSALALGGGMLFAGLAAGAPQDPRLGFMPREAYRPLLIVGVEGLENLVGHLTPYGRDNPLALKAITASSLLVAGIGQSVAASRGGREDQYHASETMLVATSMFFDVFFRWALGEMGRMQGIVYHKVHHEEEP